MRYESAAAPSTNTNAVSNKLQWFELLRDDFSDEECKSKSITVGLTGDGLLCIKFYASPHFLFAANYTLKEIRAIQIDTLIKEVFPILLGYSIVVPRKFIFS